MESTYVLEEIYADPPVCVLGTMEYKYLLYLPDLIERLSLETLKQLVPCIGPDKKDFLIKYCYDNGLSHMFLRRMAHFLD